MSGATSICTAFIFSTVISPIFVRTNYKNDFVNGRVRPFQSLQILDISAAVTLSSLNVSKKSNLSVLVRNNPKAEHMPVKKRQDF
ncbi:hypothetical protein SAMN05421882_10673 [Nitrosomonas communis]|uniref:Uncharacterized protein n=1 Tax=Nitrosomonas communis TaxID=44574 RepID=A0A1H2Z6V9_9PROT|nr:hypothetical protein SAMN05421882_10673 [Nitrosomonas communis]